MWISSIAAASGSTATRLAPERVGGGQRQHRPDPLAAGQQRVAHRLLEPGGGELVGEAQRLQVALDLGAQVLGVGRRATSTRPVSGAGGSRPPAAAADPGGPAAARAPRARAGRPGAGLGGQPGALLDQRERGVGLQLAGAQPLGGVVQPRAQLDQGIGHATEAFSVRAQRPRAAARELSARPSAARRSSAQAPGRRAPALTSASASAFWARGTRADLPARRTPRSAAIASLVQRLHRRVLDLVGAGQLLGDQLGVVDRARPRRRRAPRARSSPRSSARYSATLLVATPIRSASSSSTVAVGLGDDHADRGRPRVAARAAVDVDDELQRGAVIGVNRWRARAARRGSAARRRSRTSRLPPPEAPALAARGLAPVDDHGHVRVVGVVVGELVEQLVGERFGDDAVDHGSRCYSTSAGGAAIERPSRPTPGPFSRGGAA